MPGIRLFLVAAFLLSAPLPAAWPAAAAATGPAAAADAEQRLGTVERALADGQRREKEIQTEAARLKAEVARLRRGLVAAARTIQEREAEIAGLEARLQEVETLAAGKRARLRERHGQFSRVLVALERLARYPPEALIAHPLSPAETVRGAILLRAAVPQIERRAGRLRDELDDLSRTRKVIAARRADLAAATTALAGERTHLDGLLAQKLALKRQTDAERRKVAERMRALAREAKDLRDLLARLESERRAREKQAAAAARPANPSAPVPGLSMSRARGKLPFPAVGRVVGLYGQTTDTGLTRRGITIETAPGAQVVAPYEGKVVFAGLFRGYGQLLIIEHGEGYHSLLAGLVRIDSVIGQSVLAGEPVGVMGRQDDGKPTLYVELRRDGQPINPLPWLAARKGKVSG